MGENDDSREARGLLSQEGFFMVLKKHRTVYKKTVRIIKSKVSGLEKLGFKSELYLLTSNLVRELTQPYKMPVSPL